LRGQIRSLRAACGTQAQAADARFARTA
jgi:hypothetical protein